MDLVIAQVQEISATADDETRKTLIDTLRNLSVSLEESGDTIQRLAYLPIQLSMAQVATNLGLWEILSRSDEAQGVVELAEVVEADPLLLSKYLDWPEDTSLTSNIDLLINGFLGRILRYLASFRMINEYKEDTFGASNVTRALATPGCQAGIHHHFGMNPVLQELPRFLADTRYKNLTDPTNTPFQRAFNTEKTPYDWGQDHPLQMKHFGEWMTAQRHGMPTWFNYYPIEAECKGSNVDILFVDVGGGVGHQSVAFKQAFPHIPGRLILQDLPKVLQYAIPAEGVEPMAHDMFSSQTIRGAKYYYLRNILHNYPDEKCRMILRNLVDAMDEACSVILIDEMVLPNFGAPWQATQLDITMMAALAAIERTEKEWVELLQSAGLKVRAMYPYTKSLQDTLIAVVPN